MEQALADLLADVRAGRAESVVSHQIRLHAGLGVPTDDVPGQGLRVGPFAGGERKDGVDDRNLRRPQAGRRQEKEGEEQAAHRQTL